MSQVRAMPMGHGRGAPGAVVEKPKNLWPTLRRLLRYLRSSLWIFILVFVIVIIGALMQVLTPRLLGMGTTLIFEGVGTGSMDFDGLYRILALAGIFYAGLSVSVFLRQRLMTVVAQQTAFTLRNELKQKMSSLPVAYFDTHATGNLMSIAANDVDNIATALQQGLTQILANIVFIPGTIVVMLIIDWRLTLAAMLILPLSVLAVRILSPVTQRHNRAYAQLQGELNGHVEESISAHTVLCSFNGQEGSEQKFDAYNEGMFTTGWKSRFFGGIMMPAMVVVRNLGYILVAVGGAISVSAGRIAIGDMQAFLQYTTQFSQPLSQMAQIWNTVLTAIAAAERVFAVLDAPDKVTYAQAFANQAPGEVKIAFDNVSFAYDPEHGLLEGLNLDIKTGQMVAVVGHTGAGKSTLINLLERFYEIDGGSIRIDGIDIRNLSEQELHSRLGMVLQDSWLFSGTIFDNIRYGNDQASPDLIYEAAKAAYVDEFVWKLPNGYETLLNEEAGNISQGQRQLICIARAFAADPDILILDEATSNVDSRTEMLIQKAMRQLLQGRTSLVIAHRLSTIYDADQIVVMQQGAIVEIGSHRELLAKNGVYADIYASQFTTGLLAAEAEFSGN